MRVIRRAPRYTVDEAAAILGVNPASVRAWIRDGKLDARFTGHGTGAGYRIEHAELERQVRQRYPYLRLNLE